MGKYKSILLGIELNPESDKNLVEEAKKVVDEFGAKVTLLHVIENLAGYGASYGVAVGAELEGVLLESAEKEMAKVATQIGAANEDCIINFGSAKEMILEEAKKRNCDLIILGSHGREGLRWLLGSTANAVLHHAHCDVLAMRLK